MNYELEIVIFFVVTDLITPYFCSVTELNVSVPLLSPISFRCPNDSSIRIKNIRDHRVDSTCPYQQCITDIERLNIENRCNDNVSCDVESSNISKDCLIDQARVDITYRCSYYVGKRCDFHTPIKECGWQATSNNNFIWERRAENSERLENVTFKDHTNLEPFGFVLANGSRCGNIDYITDLISGNIVPNGIQCLSFWYNSDGNNHTVDIRLSILINAAVSSTNSTELWKTTLNSTSNKWQNYKINITEREIYRIKIRATCGEKNSRSVALDDISITNRPCKDSNKFLDCNFEDDFCKWTPGEEITFKWTRNKGNTVSNGTGPSTDHTTGSDEGFYIYLEASGVNESTKAFLNASENIPQHSCFTFWYHMYGNTMGTLNVRFIDSFNSSIVWSKSGNNEDQWHFASIEITRGGNITIVFEGIRGTHWESDIAVDDIFLVPGSCSGLVFEREKCINLTDPFNLSECPSCYLQPESIELDFRNAFQKNCSELHQRLQDSIKTTCNSTNDTEICVFNSSEYLHSYPECFTDERATIEYTCVDIYETSIGIKESQTPTNFFSTGVIIGLTMAGIVLCVSMVGIIVFCIRRSMFIHDDGMKNDSVVNTDILDTTIDSLENNSTSFSNAAYEITRVKKSIVLDPTKIEYDMSKPVSENYYLAKPLDVQPDYLYVHQGDGQYDTTNTIRHHETEKNLYSHGIDGVYDTTSHDRKEDRTDDHYDHFFGEMTNGT